MKKINIIALVLLLFWWQAGIAQNAPITAAGSALNVPPGPVTIPVTVTGFNSIGSISLTLNYNSSVLTFTGATPTAALSSMSVTSGTPGTVVIGWVTGGSPYALPDGSTIVELQFTALGGTTELTWDNASSGGAACEYTDGSFNILNDNPSDVYYKTGAVAENTAPITYAPEIINATAGPLTVPITVENFNDIGSITLVLEYNPNVLSFSGFTPNAIFGGDLVVNAAPSTGGKYKVVMSFFLLSGPGLSLSDGSSIVDLQFNFTPGPFIGNTTLLEWLKDGTSCEYATTSFIPLYDLPYDNYYIDGLITSQVAPGTYLPVNTNATPGPVTIPVTVVGMTGAAAVTLQFEYDATVLSYNGFTANAAFAGNLLVGSSVTGSTGEINISYYGTTVSLPDDDYIVELDFTYNGGTSTLVFNKNGTACEYGDANFNPLWDIPYDEYYFDGIIASQVAPLTKADSITATPGQFVSVPVRVWGFTDITSVSLTLDYDPGVLTFQDVTPNPELGVNFSSGSTIQGRLELGWFTPINPVTLPDESVIVYIHFLYEGGTSPLVWYNEGGACEYAAGITFTPLYDEPTEVYYENGVVENQLFIWAGITSDDWFTATNWSDEVVPTETSYVIIPTTPAGPNWPIFDGDKAIGEECTSLTMEDGAELTVNGNFEIQPGKTLLKDSDAILRVEGDWINQGAFEYGNSVVEFVGDQDSYIYDNYLPAQDVANYTRGTFPVGMTELTGGTTIPNGDDVSSIVNIGFSFYYGGTFYSSLKINSNGWVSLDETGSDAASSHNEYLFFKSTKPFATLAPWWDNLLADASTVISYETTTGPDGNIFTVEWKNILAFNTVSTARLNFQVKLYENTNYIEFHYGNVVAGVHSASEGASIGIKGPSGNFGDYIEGTTGRQDAFIDNLSSNTNWPDFNLRFKPPHEVVKFWELKVLKTNGATLFIETDVEVVGIE